MDNDLALLHQKIDYLTEQFEIQRRRQQELDELKQDLIPIANHMMKLSIDELTEIGAEFELEDLLFLLKHLLRNTRAWLELLDRLEGAIGMLDETRLIGHQVFANTVDTLDRMEREGYFAFVREGWAIVERIVSEFDEEDVRTLGDNIVTILTTIRNMTQPEILALVNNAVDTIRIEEPEAEEISVRALLRELGDPKVRRGMARMLNLVKILADQPQPNIHN